MNTRQQKLSASPSKGVSLQGQHDAFAAWGSQSLRMSIHTENLLLHSPAIARRRMYAET